MFIINEDNSIYATRGDAVFFTLKANDIDTKQPVDFLVGDVIRIKIFAKKNAENVVLSKDFIVTEASNEYFLRLDGKDTKFGDIISKPVDYWYEIELNPDTYPQTIVGYNDEGPVLFKLFPEGADVEDEEIPEEAIPIVDTELDVNSTRPIQNQAVAKELAILKDRDEICVVHNVDNTLDKTFRNILLKCNDGIPVMIMKQGEPPAFAVAWDEEKIDFTAGSYMKVADDFGLIRFAFVKYRLLANGTFFDKTETYDLEYTNRDF